YDPVVSPTKPGQLLGHVSKVGPTTSLVTLISDRSSAVAVYDVAHGTKGILRGAGPDAGSLVMDQVSKQHVVAAAELITRGPLLRRVVLSERDPGRAGRGCRPEPHRAVQARPGPAVRRPRQHRPGRDPAPQGARPQPAVTVAVLKALGAVFVAVLLELAVFAPLQIGSGSADIVLATVAPVALLTGSIVGAIAGFWAG